MTSAPAAKTGVAAHAYSVCETSRQDRGTPDGVVPASDVLGIVGRELRDLAVRVDEMHILVASGAGQSASDAAYVEAAQSIDVVSQHLAAIADFLGVLGLNLPDDWSIDPAPAAKVVTLSALAAKLGCPDAARNLATPAAETGWELF